jgi:hypothetical protein
VLHGERVETIRHRGYRLLRSGMALNREALHTASRSPWRRKSKP